MQNSFDHDRHNVCDATVSKEKIKAMSDELAKAAHLIQPLPAGRDIARRDEQSVVTQPKILQITPKPVADAVRSRFCADHLRTLVTNFLTLDRQRQRIACQVLLCLLGAVQINPYFPKIPSHSFAHPILPPSGRGTILEWPLPPRTAAAPVLAGLFQTIILNCDDAEHGDGKACIGAELRARLRDKMMEIKATPLSEAFLVGERVLIEYLVQELEGVENVPGYVSMARERFRKQEAVCANPDCKNGSQPASLTCSRCRTVSYCKQACQKTDWARGHKMKCFQVQYSISLVPF